MVNEVEKDWEFRVLRRGVGDLVYWKVGSGKDIVGVLTGRVIICLLHCYCTSTILCTSHIKLAAMGMLSSLL